MKRAFGIVTALIILLLVATLMAVVVKISFLTSKHSSDTYMRERAELFMQSCIENALLAIEGYNRKKNSNCLENIEFKDENNRFICKVNVERYYCYSDCPCSNKKSISTDISDGYVVLKVAVESNNDNVKNNNKQIRLQSITLQRP